MSKEEISAKIKAEAKNLGFFACGISRAEPVAEPVASQYRRWITDGGHATMGYLAGNIEKRLDPRLLVDGVRSIVSVVLNYAPARRLPGGEPQLAVYALGKDYHDVVRHRLRQLADTLGFTDYRAFCDSAPVLERYWAERSGLGWIGRNHQLIIPHAGSMFFLGELFLPVELAYDSPIEPHCGKCRACVAACPTGAIGGIEFDSRLCLSYQTIENRGEIPRELSDKAGDTFYGCDRCLAACPWNRFARPNDTPELQPSDELAGMTRQDWLNLSENDYRRLFKGSAVKRAKYAGLMRNIHQILGGEKK